MSSTHLFQRIGASAKLLLALLLISSTAFAEPAAVPGQFLMKFAPSGQRVQSATAVQAQLGVEVVTFNSTTGSMLVEAASGQTVDHALAKELLAQGVIEYFEPNYILTINDQVPNDPRFGELWGLNNTGQAGGVADMDIDAPQAWGLTTGSTAVVVGVVDTGVEYNHPDLAANIWRNPGEVPGNGVDDDANGVIDDYHGYNAIDNNGDPMDQNGHGTHCAGTISGVGNNGAGVAGVAWNVKILPLRFLDAFGSGTTEGAIQAIEYAVRLKQSGVNLKVLSNSWGGGGESQALADAIQAAANADILFVAAAGNSSIDNDTLPNYPSNYDIANVVAVAALDRAGQLAYFSNYGADTVDLGAPGVDILSTYLGGGYQFLSGTSMATPHVAGVAALVASREILSATAIKDRLLGTVKVLGHLNGLMRSPGMVSAPNALTNARSPLPPPESRPSYSFRASAFAPESALGTRLLNVDDGYAEFALPFNFEYYEAGYTRIAVSANGRILLLADGAALPTGQDYSNQLGEGILVYHDDLYPSPFSGDSGVWAAANGDQVTITWVAIHYGHRGVNEPAVEVRIQAKLYSDGHLEFHYLDTEAQDSTLSNGAGATVGMAPMRGVLGNKLSISHNNGNSGYIRTGTAVTIEPAAPAAKGDFDADGLRDLAVWRPSTGMWFILPSAVNYDASQTIMHQLGLPGDIPLLGDFDGDRKPDLAVWRPSNGTWYFRYSGLNYQSIVAVQWGLFGDIPLSGDYDGDGRTDLTVYRPAVGMFYVLRSSSGFDNNAAFSGDGRAMMQIPLGGPAHDLVVGDFTGDGKDDFVTVWQLVRFWAVKDSNNQLLMSLPWGYAGDTPLACDTDGNRTSGRTVVRLNPNFTLDWYNVEDNGLVYTDNFGSIGDRSKCADYDGDGKDDNAVFRLHTGEWFIRDSSTRNIRQYQFGLPGDIAL